MNINIDITQVYNNGIYTTKITNDTGFDCYIQLRPKPPKKEYEDVFLVCAESELTIVDQYIDFRTISIIFEDPRF